VASDKKPDSLALPMELQRERAVELLSRHFANDNLSLDELERRIELAYRAGGASELQDLLRDLPESAEDATARRAAAPLPEAFTEVSDRIVSVMTETKRRGMWRPARHIDLWSVMSDTQLDLTEAVLGSGVTEFDVSAIMTSLKIIVPPGVRVVVQTSSIMSTVSDESIEPPSVGSGAPVLRLTGFALMSEIKVRVRLRERLVDPLAGL
jgi:hypothetical protein